MRMEGFDMLLSSLSMRVRLYHKDQEDTKDTKMWSIVPSRPRHGWRGADGVFAGFFFLQALLFGFNIFLAGSVLLAVEVDLAVDQHLLRQCRSAERVMVVDHQVGV